MRQSKTDYRQSFQNNHPDNAEHHLLLCCSVLEFSSDSTPIHFRTYMFIIASTDLSIGFIMNGIHISPTAVVIHFLVSSGNFVLDLKVNRDSAQMRLIVYPGIATDARPCQISVSNTVNCTLFCTRLSSSSVF